MGEAVLDLSQRFHRLDRLLTRLSRFWQLRTFDCARAPWPELRDWLESLNAKQRHTLLNDDELRAATLRTYLPEVDRLQSLIAVEASSPRPQQKLPDWLSHRIPGRKWQQILAFDEAMIDSGQPFLEWCAGKGHLGRLLAYRHQRSVTSLELQPQLCEQGQQLADKRQLDCRFHQADVMQTEVSQHLKSNQHTVALHACGQLHIQLLQQSTAKHVKAISLSPCCYHLIDTDHYQPLSRCTQQSALKLSKYDLGLAVQETVTAGAREQRLRQRELAWRLGFDQLQRHVRGIDRYLPCPTLPRSLLSGNFEGYCHAMARRRQLELPKKVDWDRFEQQGIERISTVEQLEIVRQLFRRPLEIWLVLDRILFLQEQGYRVTLNEFCEHSLTPRNLLIQAEYI